MQLRIVPLNVVEEKVNAQLFPPDGDYVTWIRANNPDYPEFETSNVKLHLFHLEENEFTYRTFIFPETYEPLIRGHLRGKDGFGDYSTIYLEVDMKVLLRYTLKRTSIVREPKGEEKPTIHFRAKLDGDTLIEDWIEAGMPEPWGREVG